MNQKIFFYKKISFIKKIFLFSIFFFLSIFYLWILTYSNEFIIIEENIDNFYIIPFDKEGKKIPYINKQVLHSNIDKNILSPKKNDLIKYSIQIYASIFYEDVKEKLDFYLQKDIFNKNDFSIVVLEHSIGHEYLLIYKNFETNNLASDYCFNYLKFINNCLIVNVQNLD